MSATGTGLVQLLTGSDSQSSHTEWKENYVDPHSGKVISGRQDSVLRRRMAEVRPPLVFPRWLTAGRQRSEWQAHQQQHLRRRRLSISNSVSFFPTRIRTSITSCRLQRLRLEPDLDRLATGAPIETLTALVGDRRDTKLAYSADGKIAFARASQGGSSIYVLDAPGAAPRRVTNGQSDRAPDFSPDSSKIVFSHGYADIALVGVGGGSVQLLSLPSSPDGFCGYVNSPVFSADGSRIALRRGVYGPTGERRKRPLHHCPRRQRVHADRRRRVCPQLAAAAAPATSWSAPQGEGEERQDQAQQKRQGGDRAIICGGTPCKASCPSAKLKVEGRKPCPVRTRLARKLAPGKRARLGIKVFGSCLASLEKAGKGRLLTRVKVKDALGKKVLTLKSTLVPAARAKKNTARR